MDLNHRVTTRGNGFTVRRFQPLSHLPITTSKLSIAKQLWGGVCRSLTDPLLFLRHNPALDRLNWLTTPKSFPRKKPKLRNRFWMGCDNPLHFRSRRDRTATIRLRSRVFKCQWSVDNLNLYKQVLNPLCIKRFKTEVCWNPLKTDLRVDIQLSLLKLLNVTPFI